MAIIKEVGTIVLNANAYANLTDADAYHETQGNTAWATTFTDDDAKEAALVRATLMIESRYRGRWFGFKTNNSSAVPKTAQLLAWPRRKVKAQDPDSTTTLTPLKTPDNIEIGINTIPLEVFQANIEAALLLLQGSNLVPDTVGQDKYVTRNKVDVIEQEFKAETPAIDIFPLIDQMLQDLASVGGVNLTMVVGLSQVELDAIENAGATERWLDSIRS